VSLPPSRIVYIFGLGVCLLKSSAALAVGGIVTDGSAGPAQALAGTQITIPQSLGTTHGSNLFHSFSHFNINAGQTVTFTGADSLQNVISRVTGGESSSIDGALKSEIGHAEFYLINPAGITFGAHAQIDVPAAFHASTAAQLKFKNGGVFDAANAAASSFSSAAPTAFGFVGHSTANNGLIEAEGARLAVKQGQTLDIVAGQILLVNGAQLKAPGGEIRLAAQPRPGEVSLERTALGKLPLPDKVPPGAIAIDGGLVLVGQIKPPSPQQPSLLGMAGAAVAQRLNLKGVSVNLVGGRQLEDSRALPDYCGGASGSSLILQGQGGMPRRSRELVLH
jgi:filamentous hemagglutinin family protein